jgi:hypothetical protein
MASVANIHNDFVKIDCDDSAQYMVNIQCPLSSWDEVHILPIISDLDAPGNAINWYATCSLVNDQVIGIFAGDNSAMANYPMIFKNHNANGSFNSTYTVTFHKFDDSAIAATQLTGECIIFFRFIKYKPTNQSQAEEKSRWE